jgi:metallo-beta-lactamase class B
MKRNTAARVAMLGIGIASVGFVRGDDTPSTGLGGAARAFAKAQIERGLQAMNRPFEPLRVVGPIYYVGASDVTSFLIATPDGLILIDSGFATTVPMIRDHVRALGFRFEDVKILLNTHAHIDHAGGHATVKRLTGASIVMSAADARLLAAGGKGDVLPVGDDVLGYEPTTADRVIGDGDHVTLGGFTLTAHLTPGHTRGATTWTTTIEVDGQRRDVVFFSSTSLLPGVRLVNNPRYPEIADDFARSFRTLKALPCDVFLAPHGAMFGLTGKASRARGGASLNPFLDPEGYRTYINGSERVFTERLKSERAAAGPPLPLKKRS